VSFDVIVVTGPGTTADENKNKKDDERRAPASRLRGGGCAVSVRVFYNIGKAKKLYINVKIIIKSGLTLEFVIILNLIFVIILNRV